MVKIKSIFEEIAESVFLMNDLKAANDFVINFVNEKGINEVDKVKITNEVQQLKTLIKFQTYICNALLKYEGLGMAQLNPVKDK